MIKILFVCHGNICRSPAAEYIMRNMVKKAYMDDVIEVDSAATSLEEIGNPIYPPMARVLEDHGINPGGHAARRVRPEDYEKYDYIIGMDAENKGNLLRMFSGDPDGKISLLMNSADEERDISDPWYTRDFEAAFDDIEEGCRCLFKYLKASVS